MAGRIPRVTEDIELYRGDSYVYTFEVYDDEGALVDMTGWTFLGQIRLTPDNSSTLASMTFDITNVADGELTATVSAASTTSLELPLGTAVYDIQGTDDSLVHTVRAGNVTLAKDVSRS